MEITSDSNSKSVISITSFSIQKTDPEASSSNPQTRRRGQPLTVMAVHRTVYEKI